MRLAEKNYFLYKDKLAIDDIILKIDETNSSINSVKKDIIKAINEDNFTKLEAYLKDYSEIISQIQKNNTENAKLETKLRESGRRLREFSSTITHLERIHVNELILNSKRILLHSFWIILLSSIIISHLISRKILQSLKLIEKMTLSISEGNFKTLKDIKSNDECGSVIKALNFMANELRNREEQLIQSKKLASIGVMTAGVAHELTNPLNNISMIAQTYLELYDNLSRNDRIEFMNKVESETDRMKEIVKNFLDFSKPKEPHLKQTDINLVIQKAYKLMQNMLYISNIDTQLELDESLPKIFIDENQIQQVLVNLITNAAQAMTKNGKLHIKSSLDKNKNYIEIYITDTGKGIPPELLPHIFDPFFTTKGEGGTGLGLSVSYGIIKNHKGDISVESKVGKGTTFTIRLPIYNGEEDKTNG
ncbi:MAG: ATP-binding protein [Dissulfurimicrobium sp.]|nr:sensor histidine kinase [Dissulfurimicrobium hydrothermale]UKL13560.1 HAMP domain-containing protein [Dissulfurimicrobium hydrothermale]